MTLAAAGSRPYKVHLRVPIVGLTMFISYNAIDSGLSEAERDALDSPRTRATLVAQSITVNLALIGLLLSVSRVVITASAENIPVVLYSIATVFACLAVGIPAQLLLRKRGERIKTLTQQLRARGDLHFSDEYLFREDLGRVGAALRAMHRRGDTSLDGRAREAVRHLMQKFDGEPSASQLYIANSSANDDATKAVRAAVKHRKTLVSEAIARAELAITGLEAAAAEALRK